MHFTVRHLLGQQAGPGDQKPEPRPGPWLGLLEAPSVGQDPYEVTLSLHRATSTPWR